MRHSIADDTLEISIDTKGAELQSVRDSRSGAEYLWQGNPAVWAGQAPLLFPIIGRMKGGRYSLRGEEYSLGIHGFAAASDFECVKRGERILSFLLRDSASTRLSWPFEFELELRYEIAGRRLTKEHIVRNLGSSEMLYELGGHEGYNLALRSGERMADYGLRFRGAASLRSRLLDSEIMITRETKEIALRDGRLDIKMGLFKDDALILDPPPSREAVIEDRAGEPIVSLSFADFPYLGIWTMPGAADTDYICLEPWSSLPDCAYLGPELGEKEGIRRLAAGASEVLSYSIEFGRVSGLGA
jgi:galactose mutarotase-like enzyme